MILENENTKQSKTPYIISFTLFIFSLLYLYSELIFNSLMLDVAGTSFSTPSQIEDIQYYGRIISANGFTLLLGLFAKSGFRLWRPYHWLLALFCILVCSIPVGMIFIENIVNILLGRERVEAGFDPDMGWALMIIPGIFLFLHSGGHNRALLATGLVIMAWPAMFFGQKLLVERYIIAPTSWQDRLVARYVLMARAKMEDCSMKLGEFDICILRAQDEDARSLNAVIGAFLMNASRVVLQDIDRDKNKILLEQILRRDKDKIDNAYQYYLTKLYEGKELVYRQYTNDKGRFIKYFYMPYVRVSDIYNNSLIPTSNMLYLLDKFGIEKENAWREYRAAASNYNAGIREVSRKLKNILTRVRASAYECSNTKCEKDKLNTLRFMQREYGKDWDRIEEMCGGNPMEFNCQLTAKDIEQKIHEIKDVEFEERSGYRPDIKTKEEFFELSKNTKIIGDELLKFLNKQVKEVKFTKEDLPDKITKESLKELISKKLLAVANIKWSLLSTAKFGKIIPPNLDIDSFFKALDIDFPDEKIEKKFTAMDKEQFVNKYIIDEYRAKVVDFFDSIEAEAPNYANKKHLSEKGKNYVRAVYIPPIAIGLSLFIVFLTIGKNIIFIGYSLLYLPTKYINIWSSIGKIAYIAAWAGYIFISSNFIKDLKNPYIENITYKTYYAEASRVSPLVTLSLDTIIRIQPTICRFGQRILNFKF